jgi:hypothetical protein
VKVAEGRGGGKSSRRRPGRSSRAGPASPARLVPTPHLSHRSLLRCRPYVMLLMVRPWGGDEQASATKPHGALPRARPGLPATPCPSRARPDLGPTLQPQTAAPKRQRTASLTRVKLSSSCCCAMTVRLSSTSSISPPAPRRTWGASRPPAPGAPAGAAGAAGAPGGGAGSGALPARPEAAPPAPGASSAASRSRAASSCLGFCNGPQGARQSREEGMNGLIARQATRERTAQPTPAVLAASAGPPPTAPAHRCFWRCWRSQYCAAAAICRSVASSEATTLGRER